MIAGFVKFIVWKGINIIFCFSIKLLKIFFKIVIEIEYFFLYFFKKEYMLRNK